MILSCSDEVEIETINIEDKVGQNQISLSVSLICELEARIYFKHLLKGGDVFNSSIRLKLDKLDDKIEPKIVCDISDKNFTTHIRDYSDVNILKEAMQARKEFNYINELMLCLMMDSDIKDILIRKTKNSLQKFST